MLIGSLFSGIGGLELGLEWSGLGHTVWQVEQSKYCQEVLARHWPDAQRFDDVRQVGKNSLQPVDVICGGFPCQDISGAGKGQGLAGARSGLWYQFARVIEEMRPTWVVVENVASGAKRWVDPVVSQLGGLGYETLPVPITAEAVGAPHRRARIFLVAHSDRNAVRSQYWGDQRTRGKGKVLNRVLGETRGASPPLDWAASAEASDPPWVRGVDDGVPRRLDRLKSLGNAVVPQCAEVIGHIIQELSI